MVTKGKIVDGLRRLGVQPGAILVVHSSLRSFGYVLGGATTVIQALQEAVTEDGLVIMPVHSYCLAGRPGVAPFDPAVSPSETGRIPALFWRSPGVLRSRHPTHSTAGWGGRAAELLADHENRTPVGRDSPLHRAALWGGAVLQFGVRHSSNTTLHLAEVLAGVPYLHMPAHEAWGRRVLVRQADGSVATVDLVGNERPACSAAFVAITPLLERRGLTQHARIGQCDASLTPAWPMVEAAVEALRGDPTFFLCTNETCEHCTRARQLVADLAARAAKEKNVAS
jgi:aminoglycoside 3-N-acetyltransferase